MPKSAMWGKGRNKMRGWKTKDQFLYLTVFLRAAPLSFTYSQKQTTKRLRPKYLYTERHTHLMGAVMTTSGPSLELLNKWKLSKMIKWQLLTGSPTKLWWVSLSNMELDCENIKLKLTWRKIYQKINKPTNKKNLKDGKRYTQANQGMPEAVCSKKDQYTWLQSCSGRWQGSFHVLYGVFTHIFSFHL